MILPAVNWLKFGNTTACCCALVLPLMMLLFSLPALTATPIGKLTSDFKPVAVLLATELLELDLTLEELVAIELDVFTLDEELTTELDDDTAQPATTP